MRSSYLMRNIAGVLLLFGCAAVQRGEAIVKYEKDKANPMMTKAPSSGTYALFSSTDVEPKISMALEQGADLGFKRGSDGRLLAVAGSHTTPIDNGDYYWRLR